MYKKYPVGTKIRYINGENSWHDFYEKKGTIVNIIRGYPLIYLPDSVEHSCFSTIDTPATIQCRWYEIEPLIIKNQQLLFSFMQQS